MGNDKWTMRDVERRSREEQNIMITQLSKGLCTPSALSKFENADINMGMFLLERIFQRLGSQMDRYELFGTRAELELYDRRCAILNEADQKDYECIERELEEYERLTGENMDNLQTQFILEMRGSLSLYWYKDYERGLCLLESSIAQTVPDWDKDWNSNDVIGIDEVRIFEKLFEAYGLAGRRETANELGEKLLFYLENQKENKGLYISVYNRIVCQIIPWLLEQKQERKGLTLAETALTALSESGKSFQWADLLYWRAKCLERLCEHGEVEQQEAVQALQKAYYIYRLFGQNEAAEKVRGYLTERYRWDIKH